MKVIGYGGGKGGGDGARTPIEAPDSLRSKAYARVLDLLSEGEIEGLVNGAQSIYLDDTPLQNPDGSYNFGGATWETRNGTQTQAHISGFPAVENTTSVGVEVTQVAAVTRQFTNQNLDSLRITVGVPTLYQQNTSNGDTNGASVRLAIEVQTNGGGFVRQKISAQPVPASVVGGVATGQGYQLRISVRVNGISGDESNPPQYPQVRVEYRIDGGIWSTLSEALRDRDFVAETARQTDLRTIDMRLVITGGGGTASIRFAEVVRIVDYDDITGKTTSRYQRTYPITLPGDGPWDVRVVRLTADSTVQTLQNKTYWDSVTEIIDTKLRYPNSALVGLSIDASQFTNIPTRSYDVKLLRVRVPVNYDTQTRVYTGSWDGTFKIAWTDNPAWCFYDLLTTERYGLGGFISAAQVDKWALYQIARYCDQLVPDGFGGFEPRFTCNIYLQSRGEAYKVVNDMASVFRGMVFWAAGAITAMQDSPADAAYLYTAANVIDGMFTYSGSSAKARHTVGLVTWNDPSDGHRQKVEYVEDTDGITRYGVITTQLAAIGCTSRGQANRAGRWLLFSERLETETVSFKTGVEGMICRPGQVIKVADPGRAGVRRGGRLLAATTTAATLDAPVTLTNGEAYTLSTLKADGTVQETSVVHSGGTVSELTLSPAFSEAPQLGSVWMLSSVSVQPQTFRVIGVVENDRHEFEITALAHDPGKYASVEQGLTLQPRNISVLTARPAAPQGLTLTDTLYPSGGGLKSKLLASWEPVAGAKQYVVTYQEANGNVAPEIVVTTPSAEIESVTEGMTYTVAVQAVSAIAIRGFPASADYTVLGKVSPPGNVQNFYVARNGDLLNFTWLHVPDADRDRYELRFGEVWGTASEIGSTASNSFSFISQRGGTFLIKAVDTTGNYSLIEAAVIAPNVSGINVVLMYDDSVAGFTGTKVDTMALGLTRPKQWIDLDTWDSTGTWNDNIFVGGVTLVDSTKKWTYLNQPWSAYTAPWLFTWPITEGTYTIQPIDIGYVATCTVSLDTTVETLGRTDAPWADYTDPWTTYGPPDWSWQGLVGSIRAVFEIRTSEDGANWSQWQPFILGAYRFRYVEIRADLSTLDVRYLPYMSRLVINIDVPDRVDHFEDVAVPSGGVTISFTPPFVGVQTVQATLQSAASGDRFTVTGKAYNQVTINVFDSAGAPKSGVIDVDVFGFGTRG